MRNSRIVKFLASTKFLITLLIIISLASVIGTLIPPFFDLYGSWWYIALLALLCLNILACTLSKFTLRPKTAGTIVVHLSVIVILAGGSIGALFGEKGFMKISEGETLDTFYARDDNPVKLDFALRLEDFQIDWYEPPYYVIFAQSEDGSVKMMKFAHTGEERHIEGTAFSVKLLRYLPDFSMDMATREVLSKTREPNNPAVEMLIKVGQQESRLWLFEKFPGFSQEKLPVKLAFRQQQGRPKDYKSKLKALEQGKEVLSKTIEVNDPLTYKGYAFYQSSYDPQDLSWSGLQVAKDPGVPVVYAGFALLLAGLVFIYFVKPYLK